MAASYTMQEMKDLHNENETILYPRMIIKGQCSTEELIEDIAHHTTYNTGELRGMIMALKDAMAREMSRGYSVKLDEIGTFTPSLGITEGKEAEQPAGGNRRNARSIKIRNINFRADKELIRKTEGHCTLERESGTSKLKTSRHSSEKRLKMAQDFLTTHPYMTVADYMALTGLSHTTAARELQKWGTTPETGILPKGQRTHRVYVAATTKEKD
jgi:predicted histone-like DNA-binding protein